MVKSQSEQDDRKSGGDETSDAETYLNVTDAIDSANGTDKRGKSGKKNVKKEGGKTVALLSSFMLTQVLEMKYFTDMDDDHSPLAEAVRSGNARKLADALAQALADEGHVPCEGYAIIHEGETQRSELDTRLVRDRNEAMLDRPKAVHVHAIFKFDDDQAPTLREASTVLRVDPQYVETPKNQYSWENWKAYLIHAKDPEKMPYDWREVANAHVSGTSIGNYEKAYTMNAQRWAEFKATRKTKRSQESVDHMVDEILAGRLTFEQIMRDNNLFAVYGRNKADILSALSAVAERNLVMNSQLCGAEFTQFNIGIFGDSGTGKTRLASLMCGRMAECFGWQVGVSADDHITDCLRGKQIAFIDEADVNTLGRASRMLRLLDPNNATPLDARYDTVDTALLRMMLITSPEDIVTILHDLLVLSNKRGNKHGLTEQFIRRMSLLIYLKRNVDGTVIAELDWPRYRKEPVKYKWPETAMPTDNLGSGLGKHTRSELFGDNATTERDAQCVECLHFLTGRMLNEPLPEVPVFRQTGVKPVTGEPILGSIDDPVSSVFSHNSVQRMLEAAHTFPALELTSDAAVEGGV